jgi:sugar-specific transcriptional regulator TrmB
MDNLSLEAKILMMLPILNERQTHIYLALELIALGVGGAEKVSLISGVPKSTIYRAIEEIEQGDF